MIIKTFELQKIKKNKVKIFLLYGENDGFKNQFINEFFVNNFKENINRYEENEIINNYEIFISNILNKSFFENEKIIIISRSSDKILKVVEEIIKKNIKDITLIINSGSLDKKSKIRVFFERNKNTICIPFYADDNKTLSSITYNFFKNKKISTSQEIVNLLIERCRGDRDNLNNELKKIENFSANNGKITINEILKLTNLAENYSISELADNCLSKNIKKINKIFNENVFSVDDCILIVRTLLSKSKRLFEIKKIDSSNKNIEQIISNYKPPIFWKDKEIVKNQVSKWNLKDAEKLIYKIHDIELMIKKNYYSSLNIVSDFIFNTAK